MSLQAVSWSNLEARQFVACGGMEHVHDDEDHFGGRVISPQPISKKSWLFMLSGQSPLFELLCFLDKI
jgi:hypothetical protein